MSEEDAVSELEEVIQEVQENPPPPQKIERKDRKRRFSLDTFRQLAEALKWIKRALAGVELDEDTYQGMMNVKDIRERTRISIRGIRRHVFMRTLATSGKTVTPNPYAVFKQVADEEDTYLIAKDGEQRKEYILLKRTEPQQSAVTVSLPTVHTKPTEAKKDFLGRTKKENPVQ